MKTGTLKNDIVLAETRLKQLNDISKELNNGIAKTAKNYGNLEKFLNAKDTRDILLRDPAKRAYLLTMLKTNGDQKILQIQANIKKLQTELDANKATYKISTKENKESVNQEIKRLNDLISKSQTNLKKESDKASLITNLEKVLKENSKDTQINLNKINNNSASLKQEFAEVERTDKAKNEVKVNLATLKINLNIVELIGSLLPKIRDIVKDPHKLNIQANILAAKAKGQSNIGIGWDIMHDNNLSFANTATAVLKSVKTLIRLGLEAPFIIQTELELKGQDGKNLNNIIQSNFLANILTNPALYEVLNINAQDLGNIIRNFQNDIVFAINNTISAPIKQANSSQQNKNPFPISIKSIFTLINLIINSKEQLATIVNILVLNEKIFQQMFTDPNNAFYKLVASYGVKPTLIAQFIPSIVNLIKVFPNHLENIQEILNGTMKVLMDPSPENILKVVNSVIPLLNEKDVLGGIMELLNDGNVNQVVDLARTVIPTLPQLNENQKALALKLLTGENVSKIVKLVPSIIKLLAVLPKHQESISQIVTGIIEVLGDPSSANILAIVNNVILLLNKKDVLGGIMELLNDGNINEVVSLARTVIPTLPQLNENQKELALKLLNEENVSKVVKLVPNVIKLLAVLPKHSESISKIMAEVMEILKEPTPANILAVMNNVLPLLNDKVFKTEIKALLSDANIKDLAAIAKEIIPTLNQLDEGQKILILEVLENDDILSLIGSLIRAGVLDITPKVIDTANKNQVILLKVYNLIQVQNELANPKLTEERKKELLDKAKELQLTNNDIADLSGIFFDIIKDLDISTILRENEILINKVITNYSINDTLKSFLPSSIKIADNSPLISDGFKFAVQVGKFITSSDALNNLAKEIPSNIKIILDTIDSKDNNKESLTEFMEAAKKIGLVFVNLMNNPEFIEIYKKSFKPLISNNREELKLVIDSLIESNPNIAQLNISSDLILQVLEDEESLARFSNAFNDLLEKRYFRATGSALMGFVGTSKDTKILVFQILSNVIIEYFKENIVPDFLKRLISGVALNQLLENTIEHGKTAQSADNEKESDREPPKVDLAQACQTSFVDHKSLTSYLMKNQNFSGQDIYVKLSNLEINGFNFKGSTLRGNNIIENVEFTGTNFAVNIPEDFTITLKNVTIDLKTLNSMADLINSKKIVLDNVKLSEIPRGRTADKVLDQINDPEIRSNLETGYTLRKTKQLYTEKINQVNQDPKPLQPQL